MTTDDIKAFKQKALSWADGFDVCCYLDSNEYSDQFGKYDFLVAAGVHKELNLIYGKGFESLKVFYQENRNWMFGFLGYDLKNELESLVSQNRDELEFPDLYFFIPEYLIVCKKGEISIVLGDGSVLESINAINITDACNLTSVDIQGRIDQRTYLRAVEDMQAHILRGDIYEANYCQEFFSKYAIIDPASVFRKLTEVSPTPFAGYFKQYSNYLLSASPERFLCKRGTKLISQPIKGTSKRSTDFALDEYSKVTLRNNLKEQTENVMIVDLVRNDLSKSAVKGSVKVDELFGIYGFSQVYQMISTISCELDPGIHFIDAIKNAFPMGSMTGAPKVSAMEIIESLEYSKRGIYSGALGYIEPSGDFDLNVVIRSILYNAVTKYLSFQVGGAITYAAEGASEYEECLLKISAILETLKN